MRESCYFCGEAWSCQWSVVSAHDQLIKRAKERSIYRMVRSIRTKGNETYGFVFISTRMMLVKKTAKDTWQVIQQVFFAGGGCMYPMSFEDNNVGGYSKEDYQTLREDIDDLLERLIRHEQRRRAAVSVVYGNRAKKSEGGYDHEQRNRAGTSKRHFYLLKRPGSGSNG